jgi:hypothetical protein
MAVDVAGIACGKPAFSKLHLACRNGHGAVAVFCIACSADAERQRTAHLASCPLCVDERPHSARIAMTVRTIEAWREDDALLRLLSFSS